MIAKQVFSAAVFLVIGYGYSMDRESIGSSVTRNTSLPSFFASRIFKKIVRRSKTSTSMDDKNSVCSSYLADSMEYQNNSNFQEIVLQQEPELFDNQSLRVRAQSSVSPISFSWYIGQRIFLDVSRTGHKRPASWKEIIQEVFEQESLSGYLSSKGLAAEKIESLLGSISPLEDLKNCPLDLLDKEDNLTLPEALLIMSHIEANGRRTYFLEDIGGQCFSVLQSVLENPLFNINYKNPVTGNTLLHHTVIVGDAYLASCLLKNPDIKVNICNNNSLSPMDIIYKNKNSIDKKSLDQNIKENAKRISEESSYIMIALARHKNFSSVTVVEKPKKSRFHLPQILGRKKEKDPVQ